MMLRRPTGAAVVSGGIAMHAILHKRTHRSTSPSGGPSTRRTSAARIFRRHGFEDEQVALRNYQTKPNSGANPWGFKIDDAAEGRGRTPGTPSRMARRSQNRRATSMPSGLPRRSRRGGEREGNRKSKPIQDEQLDRRNYQTKPNTSGRCSSSEKSVMLHHCRASATVLSPGRSRKARSRKEMCKSKPTAMTDA